MTYRDVTDPLQNDEKTTLVDADRLMIVDSETAPDTLKNITYDNLVINVNGAVGAWKDAPATPTRVSNTTFTVPGDFSSVTTYPFGKCTIWKWAESGVLKCAMQSIPQTYGAPNTTFTIIGDTMASIDAGSLKYAVIGPEKILFLRAGTLGAVEADAFPPITNMFGPCRVIGADPFAKTAGTTNNTTFDINIAGSTVFTTKPTLATTVAYAPTPFTADSGTSWAFGQALTIDIDAVQTTAAIDGGIVLYTFPTRLLYLT